METLLLNIQRVVPLSEKDREIILASFEFRKLEKKETLIEPGELTRCVAFVLVGCLRSYSTDDNGFEHILQFAPEGWCNTYPVSDDSMVPPFVIPCKTVAYSRHE
ncbi:MAG: Crp/Fnr family transcriptional regulator [Flavobacteriales bacterium]